ncbi:hypothetical protein H2198_001967 [Neophaeococcomyces mojaviensis]|uniref:Uncharacterized protein n=1 Tax=Neophaeococcomyces mojaviensis TaxID=3383035 RepID=A0ACC3AFE6_9EURO|nr:hypothetical protein H2198_001967 [Knufia sp. JES_112]
MAPSSYAHAISQTPAAESREQLLSRAVPPSSLTRSGRPASIAPSIYSVLSDATTIAAPQNTYRGFPSREAYLAALNDFIESKMYMSTGHQTLKGFYGDETMDDVIRNRPDVEFGWQKRRREKKAAKARRMTVAVGMDSVSEEGQRVEDRGNAPMASLTPTGSNDEQMQRTETNSSQKGGKMRRLTRVFSGGRRATVS